LVGSFLPFTVFKEWHSYHLLEQPSYNPLNPLDSSSGKRKCGKRPSVWLRRDPRHFYSHINAKHLLHGTK
jgi:hypothetical protein